MTRLVELAAKLTPAQLKEVEDFAEFLSTRAADVRAPGTHNVEPIYVETDGIIGLCKGMGGDKTDKELIREAWDAVVKKADR